jgi:hypothetical protein
MSQALILYANIHKHDVTDAITITIYPGLEATKMRLHFQEKMSPSIAIAR